MVEASRCHGVFETCLAWKLALVINPGVDTAQKGSAAKAVILSMVIGHLKVGPLQPSLVQGPIVTNHDNNIMSRGNDETLTFFPTIPTKCAHV